MAEATTSVIVHVPPRELHVDQNSRDIDVTSPENKALTKSLKQYGQLQTIGLIRLVDGSYRVRYGYRRTLCGIEADLETMRGEVIADEAVTPSTEIDRLSQQWEENEARSAFTNGEKAAIVLSLSLEGLSDTAIAKKLTGLKDAKAVKQARAVAGSEVASEAVDSLALTLEQGAALAEFEDNPAAVEELLESAQNGRFEWSVTRLRQIAVREAGEREQRVELEAAGYRTVSEDDGTPLQSLETAEGGSISEEEHATCPGHVAWVEWRWIRDLSNPEDKGDHGWKKFVGCDQADEFHYYGDDAEDAELLAAAQEEKRRERRENRQARDNWEAADEVRKGFLKALLSRKTPPAGAARFVAESLLRGDYAIRKAMQTDYTTGVQLFGVEGKIPDSQKPNIWMNDGRREDMLSLIDESTSEKRAQMIALGAVLAAYEQVEMHRDGWKNGDQERSRYLRYLEQIGHTLSEIEQQSAKDGEQRAS